MKQNYKGMIVCPWSILRSGEGFQLFCMIIASGDSCIRESRCSACFAHLVIRPFFYSKMNYFNKGRLLSTYSPSGGGRGSWHCIHHAYREVRGGGQRQYVHTQVEDVFKDIFVMVDCRRQSSNASFTWEAMGASRINVALNMTVGTDSISNAMVSFLKFGIWWCRPRHVTPD